MLFSYVQSIYNRISVIDEINIYTFTPEALLFSLINTGILFIIINYFIKKWLKSDVLRSNEMIKIFGASLIMYPVSMQLLGLMIAFLFNNIEQNFNQNVFFKTTFMFFLDGFIYGSFILTYYYFNKSKKHQNQLSKYNQALSESKIQQLKSQLNPHFLFNNLNILDQLIDEDKRKASDFLNEFADIYRYILETSDKKTVSIIDEIVFTKQYFNIIQHKYADAYQLNLEFKNNNQFIVPLTLQLLIENAVQHNLGTTKSPICISIFIDENILVSNNINIKRNFKSTHGRALNNLKEQYKLLTKKSIKIVQSNTFFSIEIPNIDKQI